MAAQGEEHVDVESSLREEGSTTETKDNSSAQNEENTDFEESEPLVQESGRDGTDYCDVYRNGNFGVTRGRINFVRAKRWSVAHLVSSSIMTCFTLVCVILMAVNNNYWVNSSFGGLSDGFMTVSIICSIVGVATSCSSWYLVRNIAVVRRPLFVLLVVRVLALLECLLVVAGLVLTLSVAADAIEKDPWASYYRYYREEKHTDTEPLDVGSFRALCVLLVLAMVIDGITAAVWLFHWWRCCQRCECFKSVCVFEPGEALAPGVSNPPTGIVRECAYVCWAIYRTDWTII